jgi:hypothetical protein
VPRTASPGEPGSASPSRGRGRSSYQPGSPAVKICGLSPGRTVLVSWGHRGAEVGAGAGQRADEPVGRVLGALRATDRGSADRTSVSSDGARDPGAQTLVCARIAACPPEPRASRTGEPPVRRMARGTSTKRSELDVEHLTARLRERGVARWGDEVEVWAIVDPPELRKPYARELPALMWVRSCSAPPTCSASSAAASTGSASTAGSGHPPGTPGNAAAASRAGGPLPDSTWGIASRSAPTPHASGRMSRPSDPGWPAGP